MNEVKAIIGKLKTDVNSMLFTEERINKNLFKRLKKSSNAEDKKLANLILALKTLMI